MNGSVTRYSSSRLLKKAQTCRWRPSTDPANRIGRVERMNASSPRPVRAFVDATADLLMTTIAGAANRASGRDDSPTTEREEIGIQKALDATRIPGAIIHVRAAA